MDKEFWKGDGESSGWGYMTDDHRNAITLAAIEDWKNGRLKRIIKELSQFDDKKPEDLESEFDHFDVANSYPTSPFKGCNIVDLDFVYNHLTGI